MRGRRALTTNERARRFSVGFQAVEDRFALLPTSPSAVLPEDRRFRFVTVGYEDVGNEFVKLNYVNRDLRHEDFNLARRTFVEIGVSPAALRTESTTER